MIVRGNSFGESKNKGRKWVHTKPTHLRELQLSANLFLPSGISLLGLWLRLSGKLGRTQTVRPTQLPTTLTRTPVCGIQLYGEQKEVFVHFGNARSRDTFQKECSVNCNWKVHQWWEETPQQSCKRQLAVTMVSLSKQGLTFCICQFFINIVGISAVVNLKKRHPSWHLSPQIWREGGNNKYVNFSDCDRNWKLESTKNLRLYCRGITSRKNT